ncbi:TPA: hypothetical protein H1011_03035 [archaeon]|uniref:CARDB domain-containing protein n=1 Tax=Candidatus Undinarchaeum marinum TaxID=2756141 RepID=A0A832UZY9_9ARCH|nr:hypothetical protein [Candidatus Undinarchaeum marinum]
MKGIKIVGMVVLFFALIAAPAHAFVDIEISSLSINDSEIRSGEPLEIQTSLKNLGNETVGNISVYFNIVNSNASVNWTIIDSNNGFSAGESRTYTQSWTAGIPGDYTFTASYNINDTGNSINDTNLSNNELQMNFSVLKDLEFVSLDIYPRNITFGADSKAEQSISITGYLKENGTGANYSILVYLNEALKEYLIPDTNNSGRFTATLTPDELGFLQEGNYTISLNVTEGSTVLLNHSETIRVESSYLYQVDTATPGSLNYDDIELRNPSVDSDKIRSTMGEEMLFSVDVHFRDFQNDYPTNAKVYLNINGERAAEQNVTLVSGKSKKLNFLIQTDNDKIQDKLGTYSVRFEAEVIGSTERDVSREINFIVVEKQGEFSPEIDTLTPEVFINGTGSVNLSLRVYNKDTVTKSFSIYVDKINATISPNNVTLGFGQEADITATINFGNNTIGNNTMRVYIKSSDGDYDYTTVNVDVRSETGEGLYSGGAVTGLFTFMKGGGMISVIAGIILLSLVMTYYIRSQRSRHGMKPGKEKEDDEEMAIITEALEIVDTSQEESEEHSNKKAAPFTGIAGILKQAETQRGGATDVVSGERLDLSKIELRNFRQTGESHKTPQKEGTEKASPEEVETLINNLEEVISSFNRTHQEAIELREVLEGLTGKVQSLEKTEKSEQDDAKGKKSKKSTGKGKRKRSKKQPESEYIESVIDTLDENQ